MLGLVHFETESILSLEIKIIIVKIIIFITKCRIIGKEGKMYEENLKFKQKFKKINNSKSNKYAKISHLRLTYLVIN